MQIRDVIIVGAGPAGLAAGIAAKRSGLDFSIVEKGVLVNSIFRFPVNMVFFTTPELLEIGGLPLVSPFEKPTRQEALKYYRRVVDTFELPIEFEEQVFAIEREQGPDRAEIFAVETRSAKGVRRIRHGRNVVLAIGYFDHPNFIGVPGEDLPHVFHYYDEPHGYYRKRVVIVGGGNSAAETALELFRSGAYVTVVHRHAQLKPSIKYWVRPDIENRIKEGSVTGLFNTRLTEIHPTTVTVERNGKTEEIAADVVFLLTGYHPDCDLYRRAGIRMAKDTMTPELNPATFETNVPGIFLAGGAICGRDTSNIFIENGRFHGEKIVEVIAQRLGKRVQKAPVRAESKEQRAREEG
ncbi:MAG TPA: YpdA family putative bacillithiol disulfide reductase [Vicinamibacterales bacterium]|nr:YpdA family putative bacillithiol disulfide reductase [Vicinamibacterales bacterium]